MDVDAVLRELVREWKRINRVIARLEAQQLEMKLQHPVHRGRKSMAPEERLEVSRRMKEYWKARHAREKQESGFSEPSPEEPPTGPAPS